MDELITVIISESRRLSANGQDCGYEEFERLVELRQALTDRVTELRPLTQEQRSRLEELKDYDAILLGHMERLKNEAEAGLARLVQSKKQREAYNSFGYSESFMYDSKK